MLPIRLMPPLRAPPHTHLDGDLWRVVRVAHLGGHVEAEVGVVRDDIVADLDHLGGGGGRESGGKSGWYRMTLSPILITCMRGWDSDQGEG